MTSERVRGRVFGEVAHDYDRVRPTYPPQLIEEVLATAPATLLEVGAGTGKATALVAASGRALTALEPDPAMAAVLRARRLPDVQVVEGLFEHYHPGTTVDLLYSAQAWHWLDPALRWDHAASLLAPGGTIALFWNDDSFADPRTLARVREVYRELAPEIEEDALAPTPDRFWPQAELAAHPAYTGVTNRLYSWTRTVSAADRITELSTLSFYRMLDEPLRDRLFPAVQAAIGGDLELTMLTRLYLARTRT